MKKIEGYLVKKGEIMPNGDRIDENCQFNTDRVNPIIFRGFNYSIPPIGEIESLTHDENGIKCTCKLDVDHLTIHLTRKENLLTF